MNPTFEEGMVLLASLSNRIALRSEKMEIYVQVLFIVELLPVIMCRIVFSS